MIGPVRACTITHTLFVPVSPHAEPASNSEKPKLLQDSMFPSVRPKACPVKLVSAVLVVCAFAQVLPSQPTEAAPNITAVNQKDPISVAIVVDKSLHDWSTAGIVQDSVKKFVRSLRDDDEYAVFTAAGAPKLTQEFTGDSGLVDAALKRADSGRKNTLYDSLLGAIRYLGSNAGNDRKALLTLSTGEDSGSRAHLTDVISAATRANVSVFAIAMQKGSWRAYDDLQQLAHLTGGIAYFPRGKSEFTEVAAVAAARLVGASAIGTPSQNRKSLARYSQIIVRSIPVAKSDETTGFQPGDNLLLERMVISRLQAKKLFPQVIDATDTPGDDVRSPVQGDSPHTKLELLGTIVAYRPGNHLKRGAAGLLGSGTTRLKVQFIFRDAATRKPVFSFVKEGSGASGLLAGDDAQNELQAMTRVVNALLDNIQRNR